MAQLSLGAQTKVEGQPPAGRSLTRDALRRLARSTSALVGSSILVLMVLAALLAPIVSPYDPIKASQRTSLEAPSAAHPMGTDRFGRDILSRVLWGGRLSLPVGFVSVLIAAVFGISLGLLAGYHGGRIDAIIMRMVDLMLAFPGILLALAIVAILGSSLLNLMIAVGIASIPDYVRITRGAVLSIREREFVLAARTIGARDATIIVRHILPNILPPVIVLATLGMASAIITGSTLSFLGLGIKPPTPEWGNMLDEGRGFLQRAWWVAFFPGLAIMLTVFSINLLGDGLRDALDPRLRRK
ncbi:MAG TPA: ABC transporter permease [Kouleothrix sp.]|uniref:nickel transporter permease n=1 Tax=Kouleothrix sp. TaxID=2779161 RepID=UPI002C804E56|nr:ABC transporter permease [Kouleothrix sp.]